MVILLTLPLHAGAARRALLVGVSQLVHQPPSAWLQAPRNDVALLGDALRGQGFATADVDVLADGVDGAGLPEAAGIHAALRRLLDRSRAGDFVLLYFSGHGTRLAGPPKAYREPDGLAEAFLARDARGAVAGGQALPGSLRDADIDRWVQAFLARGVFVWAVFDTCAAASMTRGAVSAGPPGDEVRFRGLPAAQLAGAAAVPPDAPVPPPPAVPPVPHARYVAFFAAESHQAAPELRLPRGTPGARPQGLLTWSLVRALQHHPPTWRALFEDLLAAYPPVIAELEQRFPGREPPSPVAEGNLDAPLFGVDAAPATALPTWAARRTAEGALIVRAGLLDGLVPGQALRVSATAEDGTVRSATARIVQAGLGDARAEVPWALADARPAATWAVTPAEPPADIALRVRSVQPLPAGLSLDYPLSVRLTGSTAADADVRVTAAAGGWRVEPLSPALAFGSAVAPDAPALHRRLQALARLRWLQRLQVLGRGGRLDGFEAALEIWRGDGLLRAGPADQAGGLAPPGAGERAVLAVRNTRGQSLDLLVSGVDAQGMARAVYPPDPFEANRFEQGTPEAPATQRFELPWLRGAPGARLLVLAVPATPRSPPRLFGLEPPAQSPRLRGEAAPAPAIYSTLLQWGAGSPSAAR